MTGTLHSSGAIVCCSTYAGGKELYCFQRYQQEIQNDVFIHKIFSNKCHNYSYYSHLHVSGTSYFGNITR
jgi:hypothetical protein